MSEYLDNSTAKIKTIQDAITDLQNAGYITAADITTAAVVSALGLTPGTNATGTKTISTDAPSGGVNGDVWYQV